MWGGRGRGGGKKTTGISGRIFAPKSTFIIHMHAHTTDMLVFAGIYMSSTAEGFAFIFGFM